MREIARKFLAVSVLLILVVLCGCGKDTNKSLGSVTPVETSELSETVLSKETEIKISEEPEEAVDYSIPDEFVDYRKFIGANISVLNVDTIGWDYEKFSQTLWDGSFFEHTGTVSVRLGWDNKTILGFFLVLDEESKITDAEREELNNQVKDIFGENIEETMVGYDFSGKGDYCFTVPKTLKQDSVCAITWNDDLLYAYMELKPKEESKELDTNDEPITPKYEPQIGMTAEEVKQSRWGEPSNINKTTYSWGTKEQWCYPGYKYIYFENGIVTAIQE